MKQKAKSSPVFHAQMMKKKALILRTLVLMPSEWVFNLCLNIFRESNSLPPRTTIIGARGTGFEAIYYLGSNAVSAT